METRIKNKELESKIMDPLNAVRLFVSKKALVAFGGMGGQSVPKLIPDAIARLEESEDMNFSLTVFTGGSGTPRFENDLSKVSVPRRYYYLSGNYFRERVNHRDTEFFDYWVSEYSRFIRDGTITRGRMLDLTVIEATAIDENGNIVPSLSVDSSAAFIESSKKVIIEVNESKPILNGLHDIYLPEYGKPIHIVNVLDRIGNPTIKIPKSKIAAIVISSEKEEAGGSYRAVDENDFKIAKNISSFLEGEYYRGFLQQRNPIQLGAGPVASAVMSTLTMEHLQIWSEIIPAKWFNSLGTKVDSISASALYTIQGEESYLDYLFDNMDFAKKHIVLRPNEVTNSAEVIQRLGVVAVQQAIEIDIFGAANVSHINGMIHNGVGGSGDFTRAARLVIVALPSTASNEGYSRIVPMLLNTDIPKQDIDVVITEYGVADLRGFSPRERAKEIIEKCSHPKYKDILLRYYEKAFSKNGHIPVDLEAVLEFSKSEKP